MFEFVQKFFDAILRPPRRPLGFVVAAVTDRGLVRPENQDSWITSPGADFLCVADGMGGGEGGALASRWTCGSLEEAWRTSPAGEGQETVELRLRDALQDVNGRIRAHAKEKGYRMMGTTIAALLLHAGATNRVRIFHVGDTRIYRFRLGRLDLLTRDHTVGNELGTALSGTSEDQAKALRARSNPLTHILTRAVGTELRVRPEWRTVDLLRGDRFLLCSDGVHDMLDDGAIAEILRTAPTPRVASLRLEAAVRKAGAADNYTILCAYAVNRCRSGKQAPPSQ